MEQAIADWTAANAGLPKLWENIKHVPDAESGGPPTLRAARQRRIPRGWEHGYTENRHRRGPGGLPLGLEGLWRPVRLRRCGPSPNAALASAKCSSSSTASSASRRDDPGPPWRDLLRHGPVGQRQVHADPHAEPPDRAERRPSLREGQGPRQARRRRASADARHHIGMVFQSVALLPHRTVLENARVRPGGAGHRQGGPAPHRRGGAREGRPRRLAAAPSG